MEAIPPKDESRKATAIAMVTPGTGDIRAMAQNRVWGTSKSDKKWWETTYNYAVDLADGGTQGMQAGSTFKIFTIVAALEKGISPFTVINAPPRKEFTGFVGCNGAPCRANRAAAPSPGRSRNSTSSGNFDMFRGAAYSVNTFFAELEKRAGVCETVEAARKLGVKYADGYDLNEVKPDGQTAEVASFTLGSTEISPLTLANAYATVAAHGVYCKPRVITKIVDRDGKELSVPAPKCEQAITRNVADGAAAVLTNVVDGNISGRTGGPMTLGRDTIGKTGTIDNHAAVWFAGSTPDLGAAVWVGDPRGGYRYPLQNLTINGRYYPEVFGSSLPGPTWKKAMEGALADSAPVPMELKNEWGLLPARQASTPVPAQPVCRSPRFPGGSAPSRASATPAGGRGRVRARVSRARVRGRASSPRRSLRPALHGPSRPAGRRRNGPRSAASASFMTRPIAGMPVTPSSASRATAASTSAPTSSAVSGSGR